MMELIKIEFDRIKRKLLFTAGLCVLFAISIFIFQFERLNELFPQEKIQQIEQASDAYRMELKGINKGMNATSNSEEYRAFLEQQLSDLSMLKLYYKTDGKSKERNELEGKIDQNLYHSIEKGMHFDRAILRDNNENVKNRVLLYQTYQEKGISQKERETTPTVMYTLSTALDGFTPFMIGTCIIMILFAYNIWAQDYEYRMHYFLYTLPYRKEHIYWTRCIVYFGTMAILLLISLFSLFLPALILHGVGNEEFVIITKEFLSFSFIAPQINIAIPITDIVISECAMLFVYMFCLFAFIQLISILVKGKIESLMYTLTFFMLNVFLLQYMVQDYLLLSQFGITTIQFTLILKCFLMVIVGGIFLKIGSFIFLRGDA